MAFTVIPYGQFPASAANGNFNWTDNDINVALLDDGYTPDVDTDVEWSDVSAHELTSDGYAQQTLANKTITYVAARKENVFDADDVVFSGSPAAQYAVIFDSITGYLLGYCDFGTLVSSYVSIGLRWPAEGIYSGIAS